MSSVFKETFEFLFKWIKKTATNAPYALMSDADMACRNAAVNVFGDKLLLLMCYYHQRKAVRRKLAFVKEKDDAVFQSIMNDIHMIHLFTLDKESFNVVFALFTRKYSEEWTYYNDLLKLEVRNQALPYLSSQWALNKMTNLWFQGSNPQGPMTNNALERANQDFKENFTMNRRLSLANTITKIKQFVKEYGRGAEEDSFATDKQLKEAESYLKKFDKYIFEKSISEKTKKRMIIKVNEGPMRGKVLKIVAMPTTFLPETPEEFGKHASKVLNRRTALDWDDFEQFVKDFKSLALVEVIKIEDNELYAACCCEEGIKGKNCLHSLAVYLKTGMIKKPSEIPMVGRFNKLRGKIPCAKKQMRF